MKLLVINPNISDDVTALIEAEALRSASPGTELVVRTAGYGVEYIETRFESLIAAGAVAETIAEANLTRFIAACGRRDYDDLLDLWITVK